MKWYQDYDFVLSLFEKGIREVDETSFYFRPESPFYDHMIGYLPEYEEPYWAGDCDIPDGCEFKTAKELFEAKIYGRKSIRDRWDELEMIHFGGFDVDDWDPSLFL